jgi:hypothetical protein
VTWPLHILDAVFGEGDGGEVRGAEGGFVGVSLDCARCAVAGLR